MTRSSGRDFRMTSSTRIDVPRNCCASMGRVKRGAFCHVGRGPGFDKRNSASLPSRLRQSLSQTVPSRTTPLSLTLRLEGPDDCLAIRSVHRSAFPGENEGELVDALRAGGYSRLSLLAEEKDDLVGHILFSELAIVTAKSAVAALALAPLAVARSRQRQGIGSALVREGLRRCADQGHRIVLVVGHPAYYPRFGFSAQLAKKLTSPYAGDAFMALELVRGALQGIDGEVKYAPPFEAL
jgi:putative acetyltransferase